MARSLEAQAIRMKERAENSVLLRKLWLLALILTGLFAPSWSAFGWLCWQSYPWIFSRWSQRTSVSKGDSTRFVLIWNSCTLLPEAFFTRPGPLSVLALCTFTKIIFERPLISLLYIRYLPDEDYMTCAEKSLIPLLSCPWFYLMRCLVCLLACLPCSFEGFLLTRVTWNWWMEVQAQIPLHVPNWGQGDLYCFKCAYYVAFYIVHNLFLFLFYSCRWEGQLKLSKLLSELLPGCLFFTMVRSVSIRAGIESMNQWERENEKGKKERKKEKHTLFRYHYCLVTTLFTWWWFSIRMYSRVLKLKAFSCFIAIFCDCFSLLSILQHVQQGTYMVSSSRG